ncbi:hypothetical protein OSL43_24490, partial [Escherichia coli]|nr:hypothetical protein [Escherichia coli]
QLAKLQSLKQKQISEINKQKTDRAIYAKKLDDLQAQQEELRKTLNQLKIINDKEDANSNKNDTKIVKNNQKIRQLGS